MFLGVISSELEAVLEDLCSSESSLCLKYKISNNMIWLDSYLLTTSTEYLYENELISLIHAFWSEENYLEGIKINYNFDFFEVSVYSYLNRNTMFELP